MSLLNEMWIDYDNTWENPIEPLSTWKWKKIIQRKKSETLEKMVKLIDYWIVNKGNYDVLKNWWKYNRKKMSDEDILDYIINYHKDLGLSFMIDHILWYTEKNKNHNNIDIL